MVPAYNEASRLGESLVQMLAYLERRGKPFEVLVVDDGSVDATVEVASEFGHRGVWVLELVRNRGKGAALRHGVVASSGEKVLLTDADLSTPIEELAKLESRLHEADLVLGSRSVAGARIEVRQPWHRETMGKIFNLLVRLLGFGDFRDTQCGFKLFRGSTGRELFGALQTDGFAFDVEVLHRARRRGLRIAEVPVRWSHSAPTKVRWRHPLQMFWDLVRIRLGR